MRTRILHDVIQGLLNKGHPFVTIGRADIAIEKEIMHTVESLNSLGLVLCEVIETNKHGPFIEEWEQVGAKEPKAIQQIWYILSKEVFKVCPHSNWFRCIRKVTTMAPVFVGWVKFIGQFFEPIWASFRPLNILSAFFYGMVVSKNRGNKRTTS